MGPVSEEQTTHVDDWIDNTFAPEEQHYAQFFFHLHRLPALEKSKWAKWIAKFKLFCTHQGKRYRVTGCSRLGDVWLANNHSQDSGYDLRVNVDECSDWSDSP